MNLQDRFELLELLRDGDVQTFRARERGGGRAFEAHFASSQEMLTGFHAVIDSGIHDGRFYVVTSSSAEPAPLESAGAWRIKPSAQPGPPAPEPAAAPGDFTRMFQLRQAPEPVAAPASKPAPVPAPTSQPGQFTRAFQKPAMGPTATPVGSPAPGQPGEFTRMFQQPSALPAAPPPAPAVSGAPDNPVPASPAPASQSRGALIVIAIVVLCAIAVFVWVRRLY